MVKKCNIVNYNGNYNVQNKCRVFKLQRDESERQTWMDVIPSRSNFEINQIKWCYKLQDHWEFNLPTSTLEDYSFPRLDSEGTCWFHHFVYLSHRNPDPPSVQDKQTERPGHISCKTSRKPSTTRSGGNRTSSTKRKSNDDQEHVSPPSHRLTWGEGVPASGAPAFGWTLRVREREKQDKNKNIRSHCNLKFWILWLSFILFLYLFM